MTGGSAGPAGSAYVLLLGVVEKDSLEPEEKVLGGNISSRPQQLN